MNRASDIDKEEEMAALPLSALGAEASHLEMKRFLTMLFGKRATWKFVTALLLAALSIPAQAKDGGPGKAPDAEPSARPSPGTEGNADAPANSGNDSVRAAGGSLASITGSSLDRVMELLQAQGQELEEVRQALHEQQELTARLEAELNAVTGIHAVVVKTVPAPDAIASGGPAQEPAQNDLAQKIAKLETDLGKSREAFDERLKTFGPFAFSGDFRLRAEPTFGGPSDRSQDRFRERYRLRFNAEAVLNDQFKGGFSLASGDLNNPISTNQTANQYDTRTPIAIDRAYATYNPSWLRALTLTGGKFAYPWFNTELVWDKDLNPEGAGETLAFSTKTSILKKFSLVGFQLPFAENKRSATTNKSFFNTMVYGEQLQTFWQLGSRVRLSAYTGFYDWKFADSVAFSVLAVNSASPGDGLLALNNNGLQNSIAMVTTTNAVTGVKTITSAQFASKFGIVDSLAEFDIRTPSERWPLTFIGDFAQNTRACENIRNIPAGAVFSAPCNPHARHGYWLETSVGRTVKKGDWQVSYTRIVAEREAVIGAFNYSEIFPSTDVEIHRPEILYQLFDNVTLQLNGLFGRPLVDQGSPAPAQPLWERFQFDMTYKF